MEGKAVDILEKIVNEIKNQKYENARKLSQEIQNPVERFNVLGMISFFESKYDEAIELFKKALDMDPVNSDVLFNYSKTLFEKGEYFEAWRYLTRIGQKTWEVYDLLGDTQLNLGNPAMALYYYKKAYNESGLDELKLKYLTYKSIFDTKKKLAIFCLPHISTFIKDIAEILSNIFEVRLVLTVNQNDIISSYLWADIIWLEWGNELTVEITNKLPKGNKKVICRIHSYEVLEGFPERIKWSNIDKIIFVSDHMVEIFKTYYPEIFENVKNKILVIPNGLDLNKFQFTVRDKGFNIAVVATIDHKKDPPGWLQVIGELKKIDPHYTLHIAGNFKEIRYENYFKHFIENAGLKNNVILYGHVNDVNSFLEDKNYLLSTSIHESFGYNIAEAMARGIKPIIHNFHGAREIWPKECVYNFIYEIPEILNSEYKSEKYRRHVEDNYSLDKQIKLLTDLLIELEKVEEKKDEKIDYQDEEYRQIIKSYKEKYTENLNNTFSVIFNKGKTNQTVSVITPAYNAASFLPDLAKSLSNQSISDQIEWIIVDDCSSDNTAEVAENLGKNLDFLVKVIRNQKNGGAAYSLKKGFQQANGKYLAWVSADDYYVDNFKLEKDIKLLENGLDIVFSKHSLIGPSPESSRLFSVSDVSQDNLTLFIRITLANFLNGSSVVMKKDTYDSVGGFDEILWNVDGDYDLFSRLILSGARIGFSDTKVFNREHNARTSNQNYLMLFGSSLARSRFLRIQQIKDILLRSITSIRDLNFLQTFANRFPFFFYEIIQINGNKEMLGLVNLCVSNEILKQYSEIVDEFSKSAVFSKFVENVLKRA